MDPLKTQLDRATAQIIHLESTLIKEQKAYAYVDRMRDAYSKTNDTLWRAFNKADLERIDLRDRLTSAAGEITTLNFQNSRLRIFSFLNLVLAAIGIISAAYFYWY